MHMKNISSNILIREEHPNGVIKLILNDCDNKNTSDLLMRGRSVSASISGSAKKKSLFNSRGNVGTDKDPYFYVRKIAADPPSDIKGFKLYCNLLKTSTMNLNKELISCGLDKYKFRSAHESVMAILSEREKIETERRRESRRTTRMGATYYQKDRPDTSPPTSNLKDPKYMKKLMSPTPARAQNVSDKLSDPTKKYFFINKLTEIAPLNAKQNVQYGKLSGLSSMALDVELEKMSIDQFQFRNDHEKVMGILSIRFNTMLDLRCFGVNIPTPQSSSTKDGSVDETHMRIEVPVSVALGHSEIHSPTSSPIIHDKRKQLETLNTTEIAVELRKCNLSPEKFGFNKIKMVNALLTTEENKITSLFQKKFKKSIGVPASISQKQKNVSLADKISSKIASPESTLKMRFKMGNDLNADGGTGYREDKEELADTSISTNADSPVDDDSVTIY